MTTYDDRLARALRQIAVGPRMARMAALFDTGDAMPLIEGWRSDEMDARCTDCRHRAACDALLADRNAHPDDAGFCPNHGHFREIAARGH
ncbi:DUF6455 family protein [Albidovulum sp.]|uniref:DUF6455 family protein n=1 Tax=Albidovulum sp. TaxID=1872424 RepID=UPI0039B9A2BB